MKKWIVFLLCIAIAAFFSMRGGNVKDVQIFAAESETYSSGEIDLAMKAVIKEFRKSWKGCTLKEIRYAGDETIPAYQDWAVRNNADEVIVILSCFDVDSSGGDGSLEPNSSYKNWKWILVRSGESRWKHVDHGY